MLHQKAIDALEKHGTTAIYYSDLVRESAQHHVPKDELEQHVADRVQAHRSADGTPVDRFYEGFGWFRISKLRIPGGGVAGFATDITELKEMAVALQAAQHRAERASAAKSEYLANTSHELRTPLNAIIGASELLQLPQSLAQLSDKQRGYTAIIHDTAQHLSSLIGDLLDLSRIEAGIIDLEFEDVDVLDEVKRAINMLAFTACKQKVTLSVLPAEGQAVVRADRRKLFQIFTNLISNAVKYSPPETVTEIEIRKESDEVLVSVKDQGFGIAEEDIPIAMAPFGRARSAATRDIEGTGLGLPLTKHLVELHQGKLVLTSQVGAGTQVTVTLAQAGTRRCEAIYTI